MIEIVKRHLTLNPCYKANVEKADSRYVLFQQRGPQGGTLHSVGCPQPSALSFIKAWDKPTYTNSCVHGVIDAETGIGYETLPPNFRGWHGASGPKGSVNNTHIGIEMCESRWIRYTGGAKFEVLDLAKARADCKRAYDTAVYWFARLAKEWNWNVDTDIISHYEGGKKGIASTHADPEHYWSGLGMKYTMDGFRADVKRQMASTDMPFTDVKEGKWYYDDVLWAYENGITSGVSKDKFGIGQPCTREQVVSMLHNYDKYLENK